jgi:hypothetical protein
MQDDTSQKAPVMPLTQRVVIALSKLTPKQEKLVRGITGGLTVKEAAIQAGYKGNASATIGERTLRAPKVRTAINLLAELEGYKTGVPVEWKRERLVSIVDLCSDPHSDKWQPQAARQCIDTLNAMDGHLAPTRIHSTNVSVNFDLGIGRKPRVIEGD